MTRDKQKRPALHINMPSLQSYLQELFGSGVKLLQAGEMDSAGNQGMKEFGYGKPVHIRFEQDGRQKQVVLSTMRGDKYGHQFYWDRAAILMFQYTAGAKMEKHVRPLGLGYVDEQDNMVPVIQPREFFILHEMVQGYDYFRDLERVRKNGLSRDDTDRTMHFARWLSRVHNNKKDDPDLYLRRIRNLIGASECIFGLVDAYPCPYDIFSPEKFQALECRLVSWRWKLRRFTHRLASVHGDFHPWNVLVQPDGDFRVLDRSRGEWGEPADDICTMTSNYLLYSLCTSGRLQGDFELLYRTLWDTYLEITHDREMLEVAAPFYVFRGLVIASPQWYPGHPVEVRKQLFRFMENVLEEDELDYTRINKYLE